MSEEILVDPLIETHTYKSLFENVEGHETLFQPRIVGGTLEGVDLSESGGDLIGSTTTYDENSVTIQITEITEGASAYFMTRVSAQATADDTNAGFVRSATYGMSAGTVTVVGQIQDMYTQRDVATWDVDYTVSGGFVYLRLWGAAATTVEWKYYITRIKF